MTLLYFNSTRFVTHICTPFSALLRLPAPKCRELLSANELPLTGVAAERAQMNRRVARTPALFYTYAIQVPSHSTRDFSAGFLGLSQRTELVQHSKGSTGTLHALAKLVDFFGMYVPQHRPGSIEVFDFFGS